MRNYGITTMFALVYRALIYTDPWLAGFELRHSSNLALITAEDLAIIRLTGGFVEY